ncbi:MAG: cytochrome c3 family protein [Kofleriaceae bacterium]
MTARRVIALAVVAGCAIGFAAWAAPAPTATHFSHAEHAKRSVAIDSCDTCHALDERGQILAPAAKGHAPCLAAGCHASDFVSIGDATKTKDPARHAKASAFCLGCHDQVPKPWAKPVASTIKPSFQIHREYHVEMNHFEHTLRAGARGDRCRTCHVVDAKSFALSAGTPGHAQCLTCHNAKDLPAFTMTKCGLCHDKPARAEYFAASRPKVDVRACGSQGVAALEAKLNRPVPCFRHERIEHRTADGQPLQCAACHYMVGDKAKWGGHRYDTLKDLHRSPVIDNSGDRQHASCGKSTACHKAEVSLTRGAKCNLCHAEKSAF